MKKSSVLIVICVFTLVLVINLGFSKNIKRDPVSFTFAIIPDPQNMTERNNAYLFSMFDWVVQNKEKKNIQFVFNVGDTVNYPENKKQWEMADLAHNMLEKKGIPYAIATGNHDIYSKNNPNQRNTTYFNEYFSLKRLKKNVNFQRVKDNETSNSYYFFSIESIDFVIMTLEFSPRLATLDWASAILTKYSDKHAIIITHCYMRKGVWVSSPDRACSKEKDDQNGIGIRKHLLSKHENFFLVVSGHYSGTGFERIKKPKDRYGNEEGFGIKFDQQSYGPEDGWVRLIEFLPKTNDIYVKDYHPTLDKGSKFSPLWRSSTEKRRKSYPNVKPRDYIHHFRYNLRYNFLM